MNLPSGGHGELPGGGQRNDLVGLSSMVSHALAAAMRGMCFVGGLQLRRADEVVLVSGSRPLMPNSGRSILAYSCAILHIASHCADRQFTLFASAAGAERRLRACWSSDSASMSARKSLRYGVNGQPQPRSFLSHSLAGAAFHQAAGNTAQEHDCAVRVSQHHQR